MKFWIACLSLMTAWPAAHAQSCYDAVSKVLEREMQQEGWNSHGLESISADKVDEVLQESNELDEDQISDIRSRSAKRGYEWYVFTGTGDYSGGFQRLLMMRTQTCKISRSWTTYVE